MSCGKHRGGVDDGLLFFFLILVLLFCKPGIFGCGEDCFEECEPERC
ncbi:MAG: hypothetical protein ACI4LA_08045 [Emergencia sp.]